MKLNVNGRKHIIVLTVLSNFMVMRYKLQSMARCGVINQMVMVVRREREQ